MKFVFLINEFTQVPGEQHTVQYLRLTAEAATHEEAVEAVRGQIPEGKQIHFSFVDEPWDGG